jgi:Endodeoxyribonuclease RusA
VRDAARAVIPCLAFGDHPVELWVSVFLEQPANGRPLPDSSHWADWDNLGKGCSDALQWHEATGWGAYRDDGQVVDAHVSKRFTDGDPYVFARVPHRALGSATPLDAGGTLQYAHTYRRKADARRNKQKRVGRYRDRPAET